MAEAIGKHRIPVKSLDDYWRLYVISDVHLGQKGCHLKRFRGVIEQIAEDADAGVVLLGDQIDAIAPGDNRWDAAVLDERSIKLEDLGNIGFALNQAFLAEVEPIRDKIFAACYGNHEHVLMRRYSQTFLHDLFCTDLGAVNLGLSGFVDLQFEAKRGKCATVRVYCHHGSGAAQSPGGKINRLVRFMEMVDADLVLTGHTHEMLDYSRTRLTVDKDCSRLGHKDELGVVCGSFLRTYAQGVTNYGELRGYHPTSIGCPFVEIVPSTRTMGVTWLRG